MATKTYTVTETTSDLSGEEATTVREFAVNGSSYRLDLTDAEATQFDALLQPYVAHAQVQKLSPAKGKGNPKNKNNEIAKVRAWATAKGIAVNPQGRVPNSIVEAYRAAQTPAADATPASTPASTPAPVDPAEVTLSAPALAETSA